MQTYKRKIIKKLEFDKKKYLKKYDISKKENI